MECLFFLLCICITYIHPFTFHIEMVHLDLRPANVFLTCASSYHSMDSQDPQRLVYCSLVNTTAGNNNSSSHTMSKGRNNSGSNSSMGATLFSHILNAPPLQYALSNNNNNNNNSSNNNPTTAPTNSTSSGHLFTRTNTENSTSSTTNNTHTTTTATTITSSMTPAEAACYDVRTQVERLLVNRDYVIKLGDLGHCCRIDEKNQFQVCCECFICFICYTLFAALDESVQPSTLYIICRNLTS